MFGRQPKLLIDIILAKQEPITSSHKEYIQNWKKLLKKGYEMTSWKHLGNHKCKKIQTKDYTPRCARSLQPAESVLIKNTTQQGGNGKIRSFLKEKMHKISQVLGEEEIPCKFLQECDSKWNPECFTQIC